MEAPRIDFTTRKTLEEYNQYAQGGKSTGYGFTYLLSQSTPPEKQLLSTRKLIAPLLTKGIRRGAEIISIDGENLIDGDPTVLNAGLLPSKLGETHTFVIKDLNSDTNRSVILQSSIITENPIHTYGIIEKIIQNWLPSAKHLCHDFSGTAIS